MDGEQDCQPVPVAELNSYQRAMDNDSLVSARRVRQPIESNGRGGILPRVLGEIAAHSLAKTAIAHVVLKHVKQRRPFAVGDTVERQCMLFENSAALMALPKATGCPGWVQANAGADGYYRVLYQGDLLSDLLKNDGRALSLSEKVALIGDISALTGNGKMPLGQALALTPRLARDPARQVVTKTIGVTTSLQNNLVPRNFCRSTTSISKTSTARAPVRWAGRTDRVRAMTTASSARW